MNKHQVQLNESVRVKEGDYISYQFCNDSGNHTHYGKVEGIYTNTHDCILDIKSRHNASVRVKRDEIKAEVMTHEGYESMDFCLSSFGI